MRSTVVVHEPDAYEAWFQKNSPLTATVASAPGNPTALGGATDLRSTVPHSARSIQPR